MSMIKINTNTCLHCGQQGFIEMPEDDYEKGLTSYNEGALMQNAFPNLTPDQCEQVISGTHAKCWIEMFSPHQSQHK